MRDRIGNAESELRGLFDGSISVAAYLRARLGEISTWTLICGGATAAAAVAPPWCYVVFGTTAVTAFLPTRKGQ